MHLEELARHIRDVPDFPKPGIVFKDITPLLANPAAFSSTIEHLAERVGGLDLDGLLAIESRGFIFASALANRMNLPLQLVRKKGRLPRDTVSIPYELEYGLDHLELHRDAVEEGRRYVIVDDLIATGGTAKAVADLVRQQGGEIAAFAFVIELGFLNGRDCLGNEQVVSLIEY